MFLCLSHLYDENTETNIMRRLLVILCTAFLLLSAHFYCWTLQPLEVLLYLLYVGRLRLTILLSMKWHQYIRLWIS